MSCCLSKRVIIRDLADVFWHIGYEENIFQSNQRVSRKTRNCFPWLWSWLCHRKCKNWRFYLNCVAFSSFIAVLWQYFKKLHSKFADNLLLRVNLTITFELFLLILWQASIRSGVISQRSLPKMLGTFSSKISAYSSVEMHITSRHSLLQYWGFAKHRSSILVFSNDSFV